MEASVKLEQVATMMTTPELNGPVLQLVTPAGVGSDVAFGDRWYIGPATLGLFVRCGPDQVQFWKEGEALQVRWAEVDTDASPTVDLVLCVKVRRLRPLVSTPDPLDQHFFLTS